MLSKAALTAGNPEGDVMWGVDNTYLSRALDAGVFAPYESPALDAIPADLRGLVPEFEATPVDFGDVCVNYDIGWFDDHQLDPPTEFDDLLEPAYADLLVVENPATSSPGLAFLLATIATYGDGWRDYWTSLTANGVEVVDGWTEAYNERFSWTGAAATAGGQLRVEPAGRGDLRRPTAHRRTDGGGDVDVLPPDRVRRRPRRNGLHQTRHGRSSTSSRRSGSSVSSR